MSFAETLAEDRRIILLRALCEASGGQLNETMLKLVLTKFGHAVSRDQVRGELAWLEGQRLVRLEKLPTGDAVFWVAHLTGEGEDVASGHRHPGVARRVG